MSALFKIVTQNDQSVYFNRQKNKFEKDTLQMSLQDKIEHCLSL
jgi:hypothetical protein